MTRSICMECFKTVDDKNIRWYELPAAEKQRVVGTLYDPRDTQMCIKCYGKRIKYDLLKDLPEEERLKLDQELFEIMELLKNGN